jgi:hypothetical protein
LGLDGKRVTVLEGIADEHMLNTWDINREECRCRRLAPMTKLTEASNEDLVPY